MRVGSTSIYTNIPNVLESTKSVDSSCQSILQLDPAQINSNLFAVLLTCYIVFCVQAYVDRVPILYLQKVVLNIRRLSRESLVISFLRSKLFGIGHFALMWMVDGIGQPFFYKNCGLDLSSGRFVLKFHGKLLL